MMRKKSTCSFWLVSFFFALSFHSNLTCGYLVSCLPQTNKMIPLSISGRFDMMAKNNNRNNNNSKNKDNNNNINNHNNNINYENHIINYSKNNHQPNNNNKQVLMVRGGLLGQGVIGRRRQQDTENGRRFRRVASRLFAASEDDSDYNNHESEDEKRKKSTKKVEEGEEVEAEVKAVFTSPFTKASTPVTANDPVWQVLKQFLKFAFGSVMSLALFRYLGDVHSLSKLFRITLAGSICASISHGIAVPIDVVKTRQQLSPDKYTSIRSSLYKIQKEEGLQALSIGLTATLLGYFLQGGIKYGLYEFCKGNLFISPSNMLINLIVSSIFADTFASIVLYPMEAIRIRLVSEKSFESTTSSLVRILKEGGITELYRGLPAIFAKQIPYTIAQLCGFEYLTTTIYRLPAMASFIAGGTDGAHLGLNRMIISFCSALFAGIISAIASQPGDVILSRVNKNKGNKKTNAWKTMNQTINEKGFFGLFQGMWARFIHVSSIVTIQLIIYDYVKQMLGLPLTGAH